MAGKVGNMENEEKKPLLAIVGPTATGKSAVAVELASMIGGEVVSADSVQVYRGLDIGSGKISKDEMVASDGERIRHHLLDVVSPTEHYSIARYQEEAGAAVADIHRRGKIPILCGGSGLYIHSLVNVSYRLGKEERNTAFRDALKGEARKNGLQTLYQRLQREAPSLAAKIHPNDERRIIRGLEKSEKGEKTAAVPNWDSPFSLAIFGLYLPRPALYSRIEGRVDKMIELGLVAEVRRLLEEGIVPEAQSLTALGYKEIIPHVRGECDLKEAVRTLKQNTRHFAKRQITWFMRDPRIVWLQMDRLLAAGSGGVAEEITRILPQYRQEILLTQRIL